MIFSSSLHLHSFTPGADLCMGICIVHQSCRLYQCNIHINMSMHIPFLVAGAGGIGLAVAEKCVALGMNVCITDINPTALKAAGDQLKQLASSASVIIHTFAMDVSKADDWKRLHTLIYGAALPLGEVALLFNNAGVGMGMSAYESSLKAWMFSLDVNLRSAIIAAHTFVPSMLAQDTDSVIVNTSSVAGA